MKNAFLIILFSLFFWNCSQKSKEENLKLNQGGIEILLSKANDFKLDKKNRVQFADLAYNRIRNLSNDSITRDYYFKLAGKYYNLDECEKFINISRDVYKKALESKDSLDIAKSMYYIGNYHYNKFKNDSAYFYYSKAEKTYSQLKNKGEVKRLRLYKANILFYEKDFSGCETAIINILKILDKKKDVRLIYDCYLTLGNALEGLNDYLKALEYFEKAFLITLDLKNDSQYLLLKAQPINYIGRIYQKRDNDKNALSFFKEALSYGNFHKMEPLLYANIINNIGHSKFKLGMAYIIDYIGI